MAPAPRARRTQMAGVLCMLLGIALQALCQGVAQLVPSMAVPFRLVGGVLCVVAALLGLVLVIRGGWLATLRSPRPPG